MDLSTLNPVELVDKFRTKARSWWATYQTWQANAAKFQGTPLQAKYDALMSEGASVRAAIEKATRAIDSVSGLLQQARDALGLNGLGLLPVVIPLAIITTVVLSWRAIDAWMENAKALEAQALATLATATPAQIAAARSAMTATASRDKPILEQAKMVIIWLVAGYALYKLLPIAIEKFGKRSAA